VNFNPLSTPFIASGAAVLLITFLLIWFRKRLPVGIAFWGLYAALLLPVMGLAEKPHYTNDRHFAIVSLCGAFLLSIGISRMDIRKSLRRIFSVSIFVLVVALGALSSRQTKVWDNSVVFFEYILSVLGDDPYANDIHRRLGLVYLLNGDTEKAVSEMKSTLKLDPENATARHYLEILSQQRPSPPDNQTTPPPN
jgi:hypothetical protein